MARVALHGLDRGRPRVLSGGPPAVHPAPGAQRLRPPPPPPVEPLGRDPALTALIARAFADKPEATAPDRLAVRLRAGAEPIEPLCLAIRAGQELLASVQGWPVRLQGRAPLDLALIGPVAVEPRLQGRGLGRALMAAVVEQLDRPAVLVGDDRYYGEWGFTAAPTRRWRVEGEVERHRLLVRGCGTEVPVEGWLVEG